MSATKESPSSKRVLKKRAPASAAKRTKPDQQGFGQAITITFGEVAENHVGQQQIHDGHGRAAEGFSVNELRDLAARLPNAELVDLNSALPAGTAASAACVLVLRGGVDAMLAPRCAHGADEMFREQNALVPDKRYFDVRRQKVLQKHARHNLCFSEFAQAPEYEMRRGTIVAFDAVPCTAMVRNSLGTLLGPKAQALQGEGNYYYNPAKCGIGFHGDTERRIVVAARLGATIPLHFQWYLKSKPIGERVALQLRHGDVYVMSEKATGFDWHRPSIPTLRHAAGASKYLRL
eukprot:gnl/Spiro4/718_TR402_c0_g1_i1.p1 gnl/Spiro4/718_TR402_c0_g1~~gnl/Spiro4/718_TR402_c0_g1_i1.p1  ORF type:complete len:303 (+),score=71.17 gnl/Spiro4/718_TR402_c0_g1_i1:39-911(+)